MAEPDPVFDVRYAPTPADRERVNALKAALTARFLERLWGMSGTPLFWMRDGGALCRRCAIDNASTIMDAERDGSDPQWAVLALDNADDYDDPIQCDNCCETRRSECCD